VNWDALGSITELLGAISVIVSVLYLAAQIRQGAADVRANIIHSLHTNEIDLRSKPATDLILGRAVEKVFTELELTDDERAQFTMWLFACLVNYQQIFFEFERLKVEDEVFEAQRVRWAGRLSRLWQNQFGIALTIDLRQVFDNWYKRVASVVPNIKFKPLLSIVRPAASCGRLTTR